MGAGIIAFLDAVLNPGIQVIMTYCDFETHLRDADLLITGEGKTNRQTAYGKAPIGLARIASKYNVPVVCLSGALGEGYDEVFRFGIDAAFSIISNAMTLEEAMAISSDTVTQNAYAIAD